MTTRNIIRVVLKNEKDNFKKKKYNFHHTNLVIAFKKKKKVINEDIEVEVLVNVSNHSKWPKSR